MRTERSCENCNKKSPAALNLSDSELKELEENCVRVSFKKGDTIFKQGIFSANVIYLREGLVKIHFEDKSKEKIVKLVQAPAFIGIPAMINKKINQYSASSITDVSVCIINMESLVKFIKLNGKFAYSIITDLCKNELELYHKYVSGTQKQIQGRLAETILFFSNDVYHSDSFSIPVSRSELGNYIHATRESVSRVLKEFAVHKILKSDGKVFTILNKSKLEEYSRTN